MNDVLIQGPHCTGEIGKMELKIPVREDKGNLKSRLIRVIISCGHVIVGANLSGSARLLYCILYCGICYYSVVSPWIKTHYIYTKLKLSIRAI